MTLRKTGEPGELVLITGISHWWLRLSKPNVQNRDWGTL
jgi:hypothetical protein